jgi:fructokinase
MDKKGNTMILVVGEILYDVFPDYKRMGGAPFNFAFHLKKFGFPVRFISRVGNDADGKEIIGKLEQFGFNLDDVQIDSSHPTGSVQVRLEENGVPNFKITPDVAYDYIEFVREVHAPLIQNSELIYFGSLVQRSESGFNNIQTILSRKPSAARCFYDINLRPASYSDTVVMTSLSQANVLKINNEECDEVRRILQYKKDEDMFIQFLMNRYPLEVISLTKGDRGSEIYTPTGFFKAGTPKIENVVDSVGAGDAYAAMLAAGLLGQWRPETILRRATAFASHVCQIEGAIPESESFYDPFTPMINLGE